VACENRSRLGSSERGAAASSSKQQQSRALVSARRLSPPSTRLCPSLLRPCTPNRPRAHAHASSAMRTSQQLLLLQQHLIVARIRGQTAGSLGPRGTCRDGTLPPLQPTAHSPPTTRFDLVQSPQEFRRPDSEIAPYPQPHHPENFSLQLSRKTVGEEG